MSAHKIYKSLIILIISTSVSFANGTKIVQNNYELNMAIRDAQPGDEIVMANGIWKDTELRFKGSGEKNNPIILRAQTNGKVTLEGKSCLKIAGEFLVVEGLYFKNGYTPSRAVIEFRIDKNNIANNCIVKNCVIEDYSQLNRYEADHWVNFWGRNNHLNHCYLAGKFNHGPTIRVYLNGNQHIRNYHQITNNYFGPRPRKGGPSAETLQIGTSGTSMTPSYTNISNNFFDRCNGEVEVISSKSNFNEFKNNIFYKCEGSLVFRHGNYCRADGNIFIGDEKSAFNGGIRVINTGHWITNNYFYMVKGDEFRSALAIMNGIPKSPLNRYGQVTDVVVAYNTWVDCKSPWQFSVGANVDKKDVLPQSEIRSARPQRVILANNLIFNNSADDAPVIAYDKVDGISFERNVIDNDKTDFKSKELKQENIAIEKIHPWLFVPSIQNPQLDSVYMGFGFDDIESDLFDNPRKNKNRIGAVVKYNADDIFNIDKSKYGPDWYLKEKPASEPTIISVSEHDKNIHQKMSMAGDGDIIEFAAGTYNFEKPLSITGDLLIKSKDENDKARFNYTGPENTPTFEMNPKANLVLENIIMNGSGKQYAFAPLDGNMSFSYNLFVRNSEISGFLNILKAYKGSFADTIHFSNSSLKNSTNGIELAAETDAKGDYNAEFLYISNCKFENIQKNIINYYRGGYDESTIGGNLDVQNSQFVKCGEKEESGILLKTHGIINVNISKNSFTNNPVERIALLWGEKNNVHSENKITNSGVFKTELYLKQKIVY